MTARREQIEHGIGDTSDDLPTTPSAERNLQPILDALRPMLPSQGVVLELASGLGQHIAALAAERPDLSFHPTEPDPERRRIIDARARGLGNVGQARPLDACAPGWGSGVQVQMVLTVNLLHLISDVQLAVLLDEVAQAITPGGIFAVYGPFLRSDRSASAGDLAFQAALRAQDPAIGYKELDVIESVLSVLGFAVTRRDMPANNTLLLARKSAVPGL